MMESGQVACRSAVAERTLAIGDVHGCHRALVTLLDMLALTPSDTVVFLGDLVDHGPASNEVMTEVLALRDRCHVIVLTGNHEEMMRNAISGRGLFNAWLEAGGQAVSWRSKGASDWRLKIPHLYGGGGGWSELFSWQQEFTSRYQSCPINWQWIKHSQSSTYILWVGRSAG